jgi:hypothetical protein
MDGPEIIMLSEITQTQKVKYHASMKKVKEWNQGEGLGNIIEENVSKLHCMHLWSYDETPLYY